MELLSVVKFFRNRSQYRKIRKKVNYKSIGFGYDELGLGEGAIEVRDENMASEVVDFLQSHIDNFGVTLDAGCGFGIVLREIKRRNAKHAKVVGIDLSYENLLFSRSYAPCALSAAECLPFKNETFDLIICNDALEHFIDQNLGLREFNRILKNGGILFIQTDNTIWHFFSAIRNIFASKKRRYNRLPQPIDDDFTYWRLHKMLKNSKFKVIYFEGWGSLPILGGLLSKHFNTKQNRILKFATTRTVLLAKKI